MIVEVITIGTEILLGSIMNTNAKYLSRQLVGLGLETHYHTTVDDDKNRLASVFKIALKRADIIITTGGLGPTDDDLSKEVLAHSLGLEMIKDLQAEKDLLNRFKSRNYKMTQNNLKQTYKPEGSKLIPNERGTAPGIYIEHENKKIIMLPGPPKEMTYMFENYVLNLIKDHYHIITKSINTFGIGESQLEEDLKSLDIYEDGFDIATFAHLGTCEIKIIGKGTNKDLINSKIEDKVRIIQDKFQEHIYGYNNESLEELLIRKLKDNKYTISVCESCTGGLLASKITSIAGASNVFELAIVTYSNDSKILELDVSPNTLDKFGAVSQETAYEMARGLNNKSKANIVVSITGIAGPGGGTEDKPVGLVYFCIMVNGQGKIIKKIFTGDRLRIQEAAANTALWELNKIFKK